MRKLHQVIFWVAVFCFLTLFFGRKWGSYGEAFYFTSMLMPVAVGTSYFFNYFLVPKYLITQRYWRFGVYTYYLVVVSLFLSAVVALAAFVVLADLTFSNMNPVALDIISMGLVIYFIVFLFSFIQLSQSNRSNLTLLEQERTKNRVETLMVRENRKSVSLALEDICYIESLSDYVKIVTKTREVLTKEKISKLSEKLPSDFIRIHRSFLVNRAAVDSFGYDHVSLADVKLPVGRKYKTNTLKKLE